MTDINRLIQRTAAGDRATYELTKENFEALLQRAVKLTEAVDELAHNRSEDYLHAEDRAMLLEALEE